MDLMPAPVRPDAGPQPSSVWVVLLWMALALAFVAWVALVVFMGTLPTPSSLADAASAVSALFGIPALVLSLMCLIKVKQRPILAAVTFGASLLGMVLMVVGVLVFVFFQGAEGL